MEASKGEERSNEQAAALFGTQEVESQRTNTGQREKRSKRLKIIGVRLNHKDT